MARDWRTPLWAAFRERAEELGLDEVRIDLRYGRKPRIDVPAILVADELRVRVTDADLALLDQVEASGAVERMKSEHYASSLRRALRSVREARGRTVSLNAYVTGLVVVRAYPKRTTPTHNVYDGLVRPSALPLRPGLLETVDLTDALGTSDRIRLNALGHALFPAPDADDPAGGPARATEPADEEDEPAAEQADEIWSDHHNVIFFGPPGTGKSYLL